MISAFKAALEALPVLMFSVSLIAILFSCVLYSTESRELFPSLPKALWFVIVTMTTVGYGDITPETDIGKAIAVGLMVISALYMAMPLGIVGTAFSNAWDDRDRLLLLAALREKFELSGLKTDLVREMFVLFAHENKADHELELNLTDFRHMMMALNINVSDERIVHLFEVLDQDQDHAISYDEFIYKLFPMYQYKKQKWMGANQSIRDSKVDTSGEALTI
jgi:hypothetical protein